MSTVCVHGLGYIGLPTAAMLANHDYDVVGYDTNEEVIERLRDGDVRMNEPGLQAFLTRALESGRLEVCNRAVEAEYHAICVPTPFRSRNKVADLRFVESAGETIASHLRSDDAVILESTVPPGTTTETLQPILETSGLVAGSDFALAHCPETVLPGNVIMELKHNDRIVGGVDRRSTAAAVSLYDSFVEGEIHTTTDATTAEFVKLIQNTFRDVNIAFANEVAKISADYGIDSREAIERANVHPRVDILQPGPGVGGHCLPIDPWFLGQGSDRLDLIEAARRVNDGMANYVVELLRSELGSLADRRIAILGIAYKGNVGDTRESPGLKLADRLREGAARSEGSTTSGEIVDVVLCDPHVHDESVVGLEEAVTDADAVVITADHDEFRELSPQWVGDRMAERTIVDTKGLLDENAWIADGFRAVRI
jgi:UDP-N-acetyl-D-mannosaminuronic acid dehydrogenase